MKIEFFFDFGSPAAYLAWTRLAHLEEAGETVMRPLLLGGVFKALGSPPPGSVPAKWRWMNADLKRWAERYGVPLVIPRKFPINTIAPMRGAAALEGDPRFPVYVEAVYEAIFGRGEDISDPETLRAALKAADLDAKGILGLMTDQAVKDRLKANTEEAIERGAFGAPTFFVGDEMHFGNDRLDWVIAAAKR